MKSKRPVAVTIACFFLIYQILGTILQYIMGGIEYINFQFLPVTIFLLGLSFLALRGMWRNLVWGAVLFIFKEIFDLGFTYIYNGFGYYYGSFNIGMVLNLLIPVTMVILVLINIKKMNRKVIPGTNASTGPAASSNDRTFQVNSQTRTNCPHCGYTGIKSGDLACPQCFGKIGSDENWKRTEGRICPNCGYNPIPFFKKECPGCFQRLDR